MEAKVAESLDAHGVPWEYEPCCFRDSRFSYGQYTPDFRIPESEKQTPVFIEVCGEYDDFHKGKCETLARIIHEQGMPMNITVVSNTFFGNVAAPFGNIAYYENTDERTKFLNEVTYD